MQADDVVNRALRKELPGVLGERIQDDPMLAYHIAVCAGDPEMLEILLQKYLRGPTNRRLAVSVVSAYARWIARGARTVADAVYKERLRACGSCPHSGPPGPGVLHMIARALGTTVVCRLCGCDVQRKARLPDERCPDVACGPHGRWPARPVGR